MKSQAVLFHPTWALDHPFVQHLHSADALHSLFTSSHLGYQISNQRERDHDSTFT